MQGEKKVKASMQEAAFNEEVIIRKEISSLFIMIRSLKIRWLNQM